MNLRTARRPLDCLMDPIAFSPLVNFIVSAVVGGNGQKSEHLTQSKEERISDVVEMRWKGGRVTRVL